ncbi:MAG: GmrSD restriction endonuclease domain-containing protein [bacterium]
MKIQELIDGIRKKDIVLPEFQREYVWTRDQAKQLMVSLVKEYPVGSLLFWKTDDPPELKNVDYLPDKLGMTQVILDGQQRLTTLYMLITGRIPPFYVEDDIRYDLRDLCFNLDTGEFQYYQTSQMKGNPVWWRVVDCYNESDINVFVIAQREASEDGQALGLAKRYNDNLNTLHAVPKLDLPVQWIPPRATVTDAIDIFDLVNSQGTKLTDAELALAHVVGKWPEARRVMKDKIDELSYRHFYFDLTFLTRALTGVVVRRALFETIHDQPRAKLEEGWAQLEDILDYLVTILPERAYIHSTEDLNTTNVLIPLVVYLVENGGKFPSDRALKNAVHWLYAAHTWSRYTAQTDQRLGFDVSLVVKERSPWDPLCNQIIDQRGRIEVKPDDLEGRGVRHPLYRMAFILAKAHGAIDWSNGAPLVIPHGKSYQIHRHHIFPQSVLYGELYDSDNHLHRKIVNEIANRAFLTAKTNLSISDRLPENYFREVEEHYPGALVKQFIPMNPELWKLENYPDFLAARRELIACKVNEFMDALIAEPEVVHERPIGELIGLGESATLEFKSTLQWDVVQGKVNKHLRHSVLKTIAAFLNSAGGTLVIGVEDDGHVYGLDQDLKSTGNSLDQFEQLLTSLISDRIGPELSHFIDIRHETVDGKTVCVVDVDRPLEPAFLEGRRGREFYVRMGNTTRLLDAEETVSYVQTNWE